MTWRVSLRLPLLLTDVLMPGLSGHDRAARLGALRPGVRFVLMSLYAITRRGVVAPGLAHVQQPITPEASAREVREV